jgi:hypothetical protein
MTLVFAWSNLDTKKNIDAAESPSSVPQATEIYKIDLESQRREAFSFPRFETFDHTLGYNLEKMKTLMVKEYCG